MKIEFKIVFGSDEKEKERKKKKGKYNVAKTVIRKRIFSIRCSQNSEIRSFVLRKVSFWWFGELDLSILHGT